MSELLEVRLNDTPVGKLILVSGDRVFFAFDGEYLANSNRLILSQSFISKTGDLLTETKITHTKLPPFFSNLLPEGHLRRYLAERGGINPAREFKLIELLGEDLPGAVVVKPLDGFAAVKEEVEEPRLSGLPYRFSLAGLQLKFSALIEATSGLTIPASGVGGNWIVKLPAQNFSNVPENEWSMLHLAREVGISVPDTNLINIDDITGLPDLGVLSGIKALAVKRFDRDEHNKRIHIEDFAQVYGLYPAKKYEKVSYNNMAGVIWNLAGEQGLTEFIKRLVFTVLIGNGDMHLKNWSLLYSDGITPTLAPAYDFVSTIPYLPNDKLSLSLGGTKDMQSITLKHFQNLAKTAAVPEYLVLETVKETILKTTAAWGKNQNNYFLPREILTRINKHIDSILLR